MKNYFKHILALHVSLAYLSMLTGLGMLLFTASFFYLLTHNIGLPVFFHGILTYLMAVIGPGAIILMFAFYRKMHRQV